MFSYFLVKPLLSSEKFPAKKKRQIIQDTKIKSIHKCKLKKGENLTFTDMSFVISTCKQVHLASLI